jgi:8-oxo-dGTP pyrophosphatase MutT (NUDIX family)
MKINKFAQALKNRLNQDLPGWLAQSLMASEMHREARIIPPQISRKAGVLILLFPHQDQLWMPLIQRTVYRGVHSGQMALPGGKVEPHDEDIIDTAIRETREEIGVKVDRKQVLGQLSDIYIPPSNITVSPVLAFMSGKPSYLPEPSEVAGIAEISVQALQNPENVKIGEVGRYNDLPLEAPAFHINERVIWGATAMMLSEFLYIIRELD